MFDSIPPRAWIVLFLAITASAPATYVWRHLTHELAPRDITLPPEDLIWKSQRHLFLSLAILIGLLAFGFFVFTRQAEAFAKSDWLAPALFGAIGSYAIGTVIRGWQTDEIEPLIKGVSQSFSKIEQPKRYWSSLVWNAVLGTALTAASLGVAYDNVTPECDDQDDGPALLEALKACNTMLAESSVDKAKRAELLGNRGRVHHRLDNNRQALADYSEVLRSDPDDSYALYNRAIIHKRLGDLPRAIEDLDATLALRPENDEAYFERGLAYLNMGAFRESVADFTYLHERDPGDPYALANRGIAYAWLGEEELAERDFSLIDEDDEIWPVVLRGRAVLAMKDQNYPMVVKHLSKALEIEPEDTFALRMRADAYWEIGELDLARDEDDRLMEIEARNRSNRQGTR